MDTPHLVRSLLSQHKSFQDRIDKWGGGAQTIRKLLNVSCKLIDTHQINLARAPGKH